MGKLLKGGYVINVENGLVSQQDILLIEDKIVQIDNEIDISHAMEVVDCKGKWLIPGLIDMHVHIKMGYAPIFTAAGITTVRNTAGSVIELQNMMVAENTAHTPRVITADRLIDGPPGLWGDTSPYNLNTDDEQEAIQEVERQVAIGAEFIKVYGLLNKNVMAAVAEEAAKYNKVVSCDLIHSSKVNAIDAATMGIKWNEHASGIIQAMYPQWSMGATGYVWSGINWDEPDEELIHEVCQTLLENQVKLCPTMIIYDQADRLENYWTTTNLVMNKIYENDGLIDQWERVSKYTNGLKSLGKQHKINKKIAQVYHDMGGIVVTGTDTPAGIYTFPGMALHRELELFVESGISEIDTLRAATLVAASSMEREDIGSISIGKLADIVILNANPLEDIRNTQNIAYVFKGGKQFIQEQLLETVPTNDEIKQQIDELVMKFTECGLM